MKKEANRKIFIPTLKSFQKNLPINDQKRKFDELLEPYYSHIETELFERFKNQRKDKAIE